MAPRRVAAWAAVAFLLHGAIALAAIGTAHPISSGRDGHHYLAIASRLYTYHVNLAFPPGYPLLIRLFEPLLGYQPAAWFVSLVASTLATAFFGLLLAGSAPSPGSARGWLRDEDYGVAFFLVGSYAWLHTASTPTSESVGMALMLGGMLALRGGHELQAALCLALASCTRITFFLLVPFFCWPALRQRRYVRAAVIAAAGCAGIVVQHALSRSILGSIQGVDELQRRHWQSFVSFPLAAFFSPLFLHYNPRAVLRVTLMFGANVYALWRLRRTRWLLHSGPMLLFLSALSPYAFFRYGFDRQAVPLLSFYVWLHEEARLRPRSRPAILLAMAAASIWIAVVFVRWQANRQLP